MTTDKAKLQSIQEKARSDEALLHKLRKEQAIAHLYAPRPAPHGVGPDALADLYDFVAKTIGDVPLLYLEFGVCGGKSMRHMIQRFPNRAARFVGFDSFEGLPEDWGDKPRGTFSMKGKPPVIPDKRVSFVKGWFQDSLPPYVAKLPRKLPKAILVHYDPDLYSAALFVLCTLWYSIPEYYFIFDEFMSEEAIALHDFSRAYPVDIEFLCQTNDGGFPPRVFGRLKRKTLAEALTAAPA